MKIDLPNVTLIGIDCVDPYRLKEAMDISEIGINFGASKLLSSQRIEDERFVEISHIGSIEEYSRFCIRDLNKHVETDFVLIVQHDGFVLNPKSWNQDFLNYDYIGAPWLVDDKLVRGLNFPIESLGQLVVVNGGFSLRSKKFLQACEDLYNKRIIEKVDPEDVALCVWHKKYFLDLGLKYAPVELAKEFSIEGDYLEYEKQFGFHSFKHTNIDKWYEENNITNNHQKDSSLKTIF